VSRVLSAPIGVPVEKAAGALVMVFRKGSRAYSDEALEGAALAHKMGREQVAEQLFDEFAEDAVEHGFEALRALGKNGVEELSDDAVRGRRGCA